jgi:hypothetical protein
LHRRPFHKDKEATRAAHFASKYSYISRRVHLGSDPPHGCVYLAGLEDCGQRRLEVFARDGWKCVECGGSPANQAHYSQHTLLQLAHGGHTKISRCWCMENLKTLCHDCHVKSHHGRDF